MAREGSIKSKTRILIIALLWKGPPNNFDNLNKSKNQEIVDITRKKEKMMSIFESHYTDTSLNWYRLQMMVLRTLTFYDISSKSVLDFAAWYRLQRKVRKTLLEQNLPQLICQTKSILGLLDSPK